VIDAHVHIWRLGRNGCTWPTPDLELIHHDHVLTDVAEVVAGTGVDQVILVQSQAHDDDTLWVLAEAAASPLVAGVVGWLDHEAGRAEETIAALRKGGPLVGLRVMAQDCPPDWLDDPALHAQFAAMAEADIALDLLVRPQHLPGCARVGRLFPSLRMVVDHCAKPHIATNGLAPWCEALAPVAELPNMMCKYSGLITEAAPGAPMESLAPYVETVLDLFGPDRLIWGSDWPVLKLNGAYRAWLDFARSMIPAAHHAAVFDGNARTFYKVTS
jgi:L-fuconolactonase